MSCQNLITILWDEQNNEYHRTHYLQFPAYFYPLPSLNSVSDWICLYGAIFPISSSFSPHFCLSRYSGFSCSALLYALLVSLSASLFFSLGTHLIRMS